MAKRRKKPPGMRKPKAGQGMMGQIQKLQEEMAATQASLADEEVTTSVGGGAIELTITGDQRVLSVNVAEELLDAEEKEMLEEMLVLGINQALDESRELASSRMGSLTAGLDIPGLDGLT